MVAKLCKIYISNMYKKYKRSSKAYAIENVSLNIDSPGIYLLVGPNGAGKTTFLKLIGGLLHQTSGIIQITGTTFYFPENPAYYNNLSAIEHYNLIKSIVGEDNIVYSPEKILKLVGLPENKYIKDYSKGMKRRLNIGMGLMIKSDIMLMDEPFDGLDPSISEELSNIIKKSNDKNKIIIISSHDLSRVEDISDTIIFMKSGKLINTIANAKEHFVNIIILNNKNNEEKISNLTISYKIISNKIVIEVYEKELSKIIKKLNDAGIEIDDIKIKNMLDIYRNIIGDIND